MIIIIIITLLHSHIIVIIVMNIIMTHPAASKLDSEPRAFYYIAVHVLSLSWEINEFPTGAKSFCFEQRTAPSSSFPSSSSWASPRLRKPASSEINHGGTDGRVPGGGVTT